MIYKASGILLASSPTRETMATLNDSPSTGIHIVLIKRGSDENCDYVVSKYIDGCREWCNGHYFRSLNEAHAYYVTEVLDTISEKDLDKPKKLPEIITRISIALWLASFSSSSSKGTAR